MGGASSKQKSSTQESNTQKLNKQLFDAIKLVDVAPDDINDLLSTIGVNVVDAQGKTLLHHVRNKEIAKLLVEHGADVKAMDKQGRTPLHTVETDQIAEILIRQGADVKARDQAEFTPLHYAKNRKIAEVLIKNRADLEALSYNSFGGHQYTPLSSAVTYAKADVACCIIENLPCEQLKEKPDYLNLGSNYVYSQYWDAIKQKKKKEEEHLSNSDAFKKDNSEVLEAGMSGKVEDKQSLSVPDVATAAVTAKKESAMANTSQAQAVVKETRYQSRLTGSTLFTRPTDPEEEALTETEKRKAMLEHSPARH